MVLAKTSTITIVPSIPHGMSQEIEELEKSLKDALDEIESKLDELERTVEEIERKIEESSGQLKGLRTDI